MLPSILLFGENGTHRVCNKELGGTLMVTTFTWEHFKPCYFYPHSSCILTIAHLHEQHSRIKIDIAEHISARGE